MGGRRMDRVWIGVGALVCVVIAAVAWLLFISPQLTNRSQTESQVADAQLQNAVLQGKVAQLSSQAQQLNSYQAQLSSLGQAVPADHDLDGFTDQLMTQAATAGVTVDSITPGSPTLISSAASAAPTTTAASTVAPSTDTAAPATTATARTSSPAGNVFAITVTLVTDGPIDSERQLLQLIQTQGPRLALVLSSKFGPASDVIATTTATTAPTAGTSARSTTTASGRSTSAIKPTAATTVTTAPTTPAEAALWTMTAQLDVFVAPQTPQQESAVSALATGG